jgi:hypothetical protein
MLLHFEGKNLKNLRNGWPATIIIPARNMKATFAKVWSVLSGFVALFDNNKLVFFNQNYLTQNLLQNKSNYWGSDKKFD